MAATAITEDVAVARTAPDSSNLAPAVVTIHADRTLEYVNAGGYYSALSYLRTLPAYIDDVTLSFGDDLYERMLTDAQVCSVVGVLKAAVLADGWSLRAAEDLPDAAPVGVGKPPRPQSSPQAQEICAFCQRSLDGLVRPFIPTLLDMLDAVMFGHTVAEKVCELQTRGPDAGLLKLTKLKVKSRRATAFVVDAYQNVLGILGTRQGVGGVGSFEPLPVPDAQGRQVLDAQGLGIPTMLPRSKFAVLTIGGRAGDPRGSSMGRAAYDPWWFKQQAKGEYGKYLAQFASGSLWGTAPPDSVPIATAKVVNGVPEMKTATQILGESMRAIQNGSSVALASGNQINVLSPDGDGGEIFITAFAFFDAQIAKSILFQTLATEQAEHQARAAAETHQDVMGLVVALIKTFVCEMVQRDILTDLVRVNWGDDAADSLVPTFALGRTEQQDFAEVAKSIADLTRAGYLDLSQYPALDALLNLPGRAEGWMERHQKPDMTPGKDNPDDANNDDPNNEADPNKDEK